MYLPRRPLRCAASLFTPNTPQPYTVFQAVPHRNHITLKEIDEHLEISINLPHEDKYDYFLSNGINYRNVTLYYDAVQRLNRAYAKSTNTLHTHVSSLGFLPPPIRAAYIAILLMYHTLTTNTTNSI